jgi:hypothetical protein
MWPSSTPWWRRGLPSLVVTQDLRGQPLVKDPERPRLRLSDGTDNHVEAMSHVQDVLGDCAPRVLSLGSSKSSSELLVIRDLRHATATVRSRQDPSAAPRTPSSQDLVSSSSEGLGSLL